MRTRRAAVLFPLIMLMLLGAVPESAAAPAADPTARIAILPFAMHTPSNLNYLQSGIRDMLTSRLAQGNVQVVEKAQTEQAVKGIKEVGQNEALRIGAALKADYVLFGSITGMGNSISIDAKMVAVSGKSEPLSFYAQTKNLDEVIPQINRFAQNINQKTFGRGEPSQSTSSEAETLATRNPELLLPGAMVSGDKISYLNPNFIEVTPEGSVRQPGLWRSQTFQGGIIGMDLGDVDGDGKTEIVTIQGRKLTIYRKEYQGLKPVGIFEPTTVDRFIWVSVVDMNRDGRSYIYLTNLRRKNAVRSAADKARDPIGTGEDVSSYVLTVSGGKVQVVAERIPYFLNAIHLGQRGKVLVGQAQGEKDTNAFKGDVYEMQLRGKSLVPTVAVNAPDGCNIFNFVKADINNDKIDETLMLDDSHNLRILSGAGDQIWKGRYLFGATTNVFESKVEDRRWNQVDLFAIPSPMLIADLNKDGLLELVLNRNTTTFDKFLPDSMKLYDRGEVISLSWDQMGMVENWKTREIEGQVTGIRIGDITGEGRQQLVISMVLAKDLLKIWDSKSTIFSYDLNVNTAPGKTVKADEKETVPVKSSEPAAKPKATAPAKKRY